MIGLVGAALAALVPDEIVAVVTSDGWTLPIRHFSGPGAPVVLAHGLATDHNNFDQAEHVSLADSLRDSGFDVWVFSLRGDPDSTPPVGVGRRGWTFDDHVLLDVPALLNGVEGATGTDQVLWVGHSMGGMLLYAALSQHPDRIAAGVTVGSTVEFDARGFLWTLGHTFRFALSGSGRLPLGAVGGAVGRVWPDGPFTSLLAEPDAMAPAESRALARDALVDLSKPLLRQAWTWFEVGELCRVDGTPWVTGAQVPLLVLAGVHDRIVPVADGARVCERFSDCETVLLSKESGFSYDYGHVDPLVGRVAREEVYPRITAFLIEHTPR